MIPFSAPTKPPETDGPIPSQKTWDAARFDRSGLLEGGEEGLRNWIVQFESDRLVRIDPAKNPAFMEAAETRLRPHLFRGGQWFADYLRLRIVAVRE